MTKIIFDRRWEGGHGIGRFSSEISKRIKFDAYIDSNIKPTSPVDILVTPWYLFGNKYIYFTPGFNCPWFFVDRSIITIHDLNHIDFDDKSNFLKKMYYNIVMKRACKKSLCIFTVSEFSKKRIVEWAGIEPDKVKVVGNGVSKTFTPDGDFYNPGFKYLFCVGNRKAHKNEKRLIEAFSHLEERDGIKLLFSGEPSDEILNYIKSLNIHDEIIFTGFIDDDDLPKYYRGALALLMPSLYEGFGLPVIEAMACGTPTMVSKTTSLGEISGNASIKIDPYDILDIKKGMKEIIQSEDTRGKLIQDGFLQAKKFTWEKVVLKINLELSKTFN